MKTTVPSNFIKFLAGIMLVAVPVFVACKKDPVKPEPSNPQPQQKHNVELVYGTSSERDWQNIAMDTLYKYNADTTVDTIFMIPEYSNQWITSSATQLRNRINKLRPRHNINPNKIFGKGDLVLNSGITNNHPEIVRFFADTLKYNVVLPTKTR